MDNPDECNICMVIAEKRYIYRTPHCVVFRPDNLLGDGHLIVAPLTHLRSIAQNAVIAAQLMHTVAMKAVEPCTIVIPIGPDARQMTPHAYAQIIPAGLAVVQAIPAGEMLSGRNKAGNRSRTVRGHSDVPGGSQS